MARPRKSGARTASGRLSRAQRRIALRTAANAMARGAAADLVEESIKPRRCRHKAQLELLESRGSISRGQQGAGERLYRDYVGSGSMLGRVTVNWDRFGASPVAARHSDNDTPGAIAARERYDAAMRAIGPWLAPIVVHVAITDLPAAQWGPLNGHAKDDGAPLLRLALTALADHYRKLQAAA